MRDLQRALLKADVDVRIVLDVTENIRKRLKETDLPPGFSKRELVLKLLYDELIRILGGESKYSLDIPKGKRYVIMLIGIQGSGKTTTAAKLAYFLNKRGYKVNVICADNYRPGAYTQLKQLLEKIEVPVYWEENADSLTIVKDGLKYFSGNGVIIIDTAGRHKDEEALINEMKELWFNIKPNKVILVLDSTMGKAAGSQAEFFNKVSPIGSIILTKMDGAAKGGGALAAVVATGAKIEFLGVGEKIEDLEIFDPTRFVNRLLGIGDILSLIERFKRYEMLRSRKIQDMMSGKFSLLDLKEQLEFFGKMGAFRKIIEYLPVSFSTSPLLEKVGEEKIKKWLAAMNSMTLEELIDPSIINSSRLRRIAKGSGVTTKDVKDLIKSYNLMKRYIKSISKRRRGKIYWRL